MPVIQPPTSAGGSPEVLVTEIFEALGVPDVLCMDEHEGHILDATIAEFTDGEIEVTHEPSEDAAARRYYGETNYRQGELGSLLRGALEGADETLRGRVDSLIRYAATALVDETISGASTLPPNNNVRILPAELPLPPWPDQTNRQVMETGEELHGAGYAMLGFDGKIAQLAHRPQLVVDYGPGLQGRHKVDVQYRMLLQGQHPFVYAAIGKGPFINEFLQAWWRKRLGPEYMSVWHNTIRGGFYIGREDGIADASHEIVYGNPDYPDGTPPIADVVLASGIYAAGHEAVQAGIRNAYRMLRPLGALLLRAPQPEHTGDAEVSIEGMRDMAAEAGFDMRRAIVRDTVTRGREDVAATASGAILIYK